MARPMRRDVRVAHLWSGLAAPLTILQEAAILSPSGFPWEVGVIFSPGRHLALPRDTFGCPN